MSGRRSAYGTPFHWDHAGHDVHMLVTPAIWALFVAVALRPPFRHGPLGFAVFVMTMTFTGIPLLILALFIVPMGVTVRPGGLACVPGHGAVGITDATGSQAVSGWGVAAGDRGAVEVFQSCRQCAQCSAGDYRRCVRHGIGDMYGFVAVDRPPGLWGGYAMALSWRVEVSVIQKTTRLTKFTECRSKRPPACLVPLCKKSPPPILDRVSSAAASATDSEG